MKEATWKTRLRWENNIKMILQEVGWGGMDWIDLTEKRNRCLVLEYRNAFSKSVQCGGFIFWLRTW